MPLKIGQYEILSRDNKLIITNTDNNKSFSVSYRQKIFDKIVGERADNKTTALERIEKRQRIR